MNNSVDDCNYFSSCSHGSSGWVAVAFRGRNNDGSYCFTPRADIKMLYSKGPGPQCGHASGAALNLKA